MDSTLQAELALARFFAGSAVVLFALVVSVALRAAIDWLASRLGHAFPSKSRPATAAAAPEHRPEPVPGVLRRGGF